MPVDRWHFLPGYAPDLNPDELVWNDMRRSRTPKTPRRTNESLKAPGDDARHRQTQLGAIKRLNPALFVNANNNGMSGRVHIKADDVLKFFDKTGIVR